MVQQLHVDSRSHGVPGYLHKNPLPLNAACSEGDRCQGLAQCIGFKCDCPQGLVQHQALCVLPVPTQPPRQQNLPSGPMPQLPFPRARPDGVPQGPPGAAPFRVAGGLATAANPGERCGPAFVCVGGSSCSPDTGVCQCLAGFANMDSQCVRGRPLRRRAMMIAPAFYQSKAQMRAQTSTHRSVLISVTARPDPNSVFPPRAFTPLLSTTSSPDLSNDHPRTFPPALATYPPTLPPDVLSISYAEISSSAYLLARQCRCGPMDLPNFVSVPGEGCGSGQLCLGGSFCYGGYCVCPYFTRSYYMRCLGDFDPEYFSAPGDPCRNISDCTGGSYCRQGFCVCPLGTESVNLQCVPTQADPYSPRRYSSPGHSCVLGEECTGRSYCVNGYCTCPAGLRVSNGACVLEEGPPSAMVRPGGRCGDGLTCTGGSYCSMGRCKCPPGQSPNSGLCQPDSESASHTLFRLHDSCFRRATPPHHSPLHLRDVPNKLGCALPACKEPGIPAALRGLGPGSPGWPCSPQAKHNECRGGSTCAAGVCRCPVGMSPTMDGVCMRPGRRINNGALVRVLGEPGGASSAALPSYPPMGGAQDYEYEEHVPAVYPAPVQTVPGYPEGFPGFPFPEEIPVFRELPPGQDIQGGEYPTAALPPGYYRPHRKPVRPEYTMTATKRPPTARFARPGRPCGPSTACTGGSLCVSSICRCTPELPLLLKNECISLTGRDDPVDLDEDLLTNMSSKSRLIRSLPFASAPLAAGSVNLRQPGESCDVSTFCGGGSLCLGNLCRCPSGKIDLGGLCQDFLGPRTARPGESCLENELCVGGSWCDAGRSNLCTCPSGMRSRQGVCRQGNRRNAKPINTQFTLPKLKRSREPRSYGRNSQRTSNQTAKAQSGPMRGLGIRARPCPLPENPSACQLPECFCSSDGKGIPGGLRPSDTPQFVVLSFDDAVNGKTDKIYKGLFDGRYTNPNGCEVKGTFFVSHEWTNYDQVQWLYYKGMDLASNSVSHKPLGNEPYSRWLAEMEGQRQMMGLFAGVDAADVRGMRAPQLSPGKEAQFAMMAEVGIQWDNSIAAWPGKEEAPFWPQTLDYQLSWDCQRKGCPEGSYPGVWEVPLNQFYGYYLPAIGAHKRASMLRASLGLNETDATVLQVLRDNFERTYTTNKAPYLLTLNADFLNVLPNYGALKALETHLNELSELKDVYFVTVSQLIDWMRRPTPLSQAADHPVLSCRNEPSSRRRSPPCKEPLKCQYKTPELQSGEHLLRICADSCPKTYPWVHNPRGH